MFSSLPSKFDPTPNPNSRWFFFFKHHKYKLYESSDLEIYRKDDQLDLSLEVMYSQIRSCMAKVSTQYQYHMLP